MTMRLAPILFIILVLFGLMAIGLFLILLAGDAGEGCRYTGPGYVCP